MKSNQDLNYRGFCLHFPQFFLKWNAYIWLQIPWKSHENQIIRTDGCKSHEFLCDNLELLDYKKNKYHFTGTVLSVSQKYYIFEAQDLYATSL